MTNITKEIYARVPKIYQAESDSLFECLYNAYLRMSGSSGLVWKDLNDADRWALIDNIYEWYKSTYEIRFRMKLKCDARGTKRFVTIRDVDRKVDEKIAKASGDCKKYYGRYDFGEPYQKSKFTKCFLQGEYPSAEFILHLAVAFLFSPEEVDNLLRRYGYQGLHVKNIHHLAIYVVLNDIQGKKISSEYNPFRDIKELYEGARKLINRENAPMPREITQEEKGAFLGNSTRHIQSYLLGQNKLLDQMTLYQFVGSHADVYNMRHRRLLAEHATLARLFSVLYDNTSLSGWAEAESRYCLYRFMNHFGKDLERRRFYDNLYNKIIQMEKHPTREIMIVLWIYAYSFLFHPSVRVPCTFKKYIPFDAIEERKDNPFRKYMDDNLESFCVAAYLANQGGPLAGYYEPTSDAAWSKQGKDFFNGAELIAFINDKLSDYSWGPLNGKRSFDFYIQNLAKWRLDINDSRETNRLKVSYDGRQITLTRFAYLGEVASGAVFGYPDNVPEPLILMTEYFQCIKEHMGKTAASKKAKNRFVPLECDYYAQV